MLCQRICDVFPILINIAQFSLDTPTSRVPVSLYLHQHRVQSKFWVWANWNVKNNISWFLWNSFYYEWVHTFFISLRIIRTSFSVNCQFMSFTHFLLFFFLCLNTYYVKDISLLSGIWNKIYIFSTWHLPFCFICGVFPKHDIFTFM